jgi:hypothetical protein
MFLVEMRALALHQAARQFAVSIQCAGPGIKGLVRGLPSRHLFPEVSVSGRQHGLAAVVSCCPDHNYFVGAGMALSLPSKPSAVARKAVVEMTRNGYWWGIRIAVNA